MLLQDGKTPLHLALTYWQAAVATVELFISKGDRRQCQG